MTGLCVVTGAFGYTGKYITRRLLAEGAAVRNLTGHPDRPNPFGDRVSVAAFHFDDPPALVESLRGAATLFNSYWVRFNYGRATYEQAVENSRILFRAAAEAGIRRVVHISIANPSADSPLPYYRGKWQVEEAVRQSGLSYAILRPTVIFGAEDILINNIAWLVRRFPVFGVPGDGQYRLRPIFVEDMAELAVNAGRATENSVVDAVGPEMFTFDELLRLIAATLGRRVALVHLPPGLALLLARLISLLVGDVMLTREEVDGLLADLLASSAPPAGNTRLSEWLAANADTVGAKYASEVRRHFR